MRISRPHAVTVVGLLLGALASTGTAPAASGPTVLGNFGPTGIDVAIEDDLTLKVLAVQPGSPAEGKLEPGQIILTINGQPPVQADSEVASAEPFARFKRLASFITRAEAGDGVLRFGLRGKGGESDRVVTIQIPVLGAYSPNWPVDCPKSQRIIRANADYIASAAGESGAGLAEHTLYNGWALLMLLSTGEQADLEVVRKVYRHRMASFDGTDTGSHTWHNGLQGMAACEYYLRTGDASVMPLINAICESARKYQVHGGWTHWAKGVNPQYTAGGLLNAAGTQMLTTLLLAELCGAKVDRRTLIDALTFFYRFAGHGSNPYGDHRPEDGFGSNNGKTQMLALAMSVAARADHGGVYAMARDKSALSALYCYPNLLQGHTGGLGALWYGPAAALMADRRPALYANWLGHTQWFFELSRRFDGSFGASGAGRYDAKPFGYAVGLALTAPRRTLQITGAPASPHARPLRLPARPWGRESDLAFLTIDGGRAYRGSNDPPHVELAKIPDADEAGLFRVASHPEHVYRERAAAAMREKKLPRLIETLLNSDDPLARHTACMAIHGYEPWGLRFSIGTRSRHSLDRSAFTPAMFDALVRIVTDDDQPLWNVDHALLAMAVASTQQVASRLDAILPWLAHEEWWINESACIALTPAMQDPESLRTILPVLIESVAANTHARPRGTMTWMMQRAVADAPDQVKAMMARAFVEIYEKTPSVPDPEPGVDHSGITSVALQETLRYILDAEPAAALEGARLSVHRLDELRERELNLQIDMLIDAAESMDADGRLQLGQILVQHYRPKVIGDDPALLRRQWATGVQSVAKLNVLVAIDRLAGRAVGWQVLGRDEAGRQTWWHTSFEPKDRPRDALFERYRDVALPAHLAGWFETEYPPDQRGWTLEQARVDAVAPESYKLPERWITTQLPEAGEVLFIRKSFELDDLDFATMRLLVYSRQGYDVYLNGHRVAGDSSRSKTWHARRHYFDDAMRQHLRVGVNVLAARSFMQYFRGKEGGLDLFVEKLEHLPAVE